MTTMTTDSRELLGEARPTDARLAATVRSALGRSSAQITDWWVEPVAYIPGTPSTGALLRVCGTFSDPVDGRADRAWLIFVKVLQAPTRWADLDVIPADELELFLSSFPWRLELRAHQSGIADLLPDDLRVPVLYDVVPIGDDRVALWMEDVRLCDEPWSLDRFVRAAHALGQLAARRRPDRGEPFRPEDPLARQPGVALRFYTRGRVVHGALEPLRQDALWAHPMLAGALSAANDPDLRADFVAAGKRIPDLLDHLDTLPQTYVHGDASPQNLLVPADDPDSFVVIDWGFDCPQAIGFDLGQLLIGLAHAGESTVAELPAIHGVILPAYLAGIRTENMEVSEVDVYDGYVASLVVRAAFTALPIERLAAPPLMGDEAAAFQHLWLERVRLTRYLLDLADTVPARR